jgi:hypothetical protein
MLPDLEELIICNTIRYKKDTEIYYKKLRNAIQQQNDPEYWVKKMDCFTWKKWKNGRYINLMSECLYCNNFYSFSPTELYKSGFGTIKVLLKSHENCKESGLFPNHISMISPHWQMVHLMCDVCGDVHLTENKTELKNIFINQHRNC